MEDLIKERLEVFGYACKESDEALIHSAAEKVENRLKNLCCTEYLPEELLYEAIDMAAGEFLKAKKTFAPQDLESMDLDAAIKRAEVGDTTVIFEVGEGSKSNEQRLDEFIDWLLKSGREQIACFRKIRW